MMGSYYYYLSDQIQAPAPAPVAPVAPADTVAPVVDPFAPVAP